MRYLEFSIRLQVLCPGFVFLATHLQDVRNVQFRGSGRQESADVNGQNSGGGHVHGSHVSGGDAQKQTDAGEIVTAAEIIVYVQGGQTRKMTV